MLPSSGTLSELNQILVGTLAHCKLQKLAKLTRRQNAMKTLTSLKHDVIYTGLTVILPIGDFQNVNEKKPYCFSCLQ